jgi:hypothetical protein
MSAFGGKANNSKTFKALCVGTGFAVAFVAGWILFAVVAGYHLN